MIRAKGRRGSTVALELVVQVRVGVDVQDREPRESAGHGAQHGIRHRVVAAKCQRAVAPRDEARDPRLDPGAGLTGAREHEIAGVTQAAGAGHLARLLAPGVPRG